jgi:hypothetical protein
MVSAFGSTDAPTSSGVDPVAIANTMAAWVKQYELDGIDVDYEGGNAPTRQTAFTDFPSRISMLSTLEQEALRYAFLFLHPNRSLIFI